MKIDNMRLEHHEKVVKMAQKEQQEAAAAARRLRKGSGIYRGFCRRRDQCDLKRPRRETISSRVVRR